MVINIIANTRNQKLEQNITIVATNISLTDVLNQIGGETGLEFFLLDDKEIVIKELIIKNQTVRSVLDQICKTFNLIYTAKENCIAINNGNPITHKMYYIKFFHTNDNTTDNRGNKSFWKNDVFWCSVQNFLTQITNNYAIDQYNGTISVTCEQNIHAIIENYVTTINNHIYTPIEITCTFIEYINENGKNSGVSNILANFFTNTANNINQTRITENIIKSLAEITRNQINSTNCKIIAQKKLTLLSQQVSQIYIKDTEIRENKDPIYSGNSGKFLTATTKRDETDKDGIWFSVAPLIIQDKIICKIIFDIHRLGVYDNQMKKSGLTTTVCLPQNQIVVLGDLSSAVKTKTKSRWFFGLIPYNSYELKNTSIVLLLQGRVL